MTPTLSADAYDLRLDPGFHEATVGGEHEQDQDHPLSACPSATTLPDGRIYKNAFGLDPMTDAACDSLARREAKPLTDSIGLD